MGAGAPSGVMTMVGRAQAVGHWLKTKGAYLLLGASGFVSILLRADRADRLGTSLVLAAVALGGVGVWVAAFRARLRRRIRLFESTHGAQWLLHGAVSESVVGPARSGQPASSAGRIDLFVRPSGRVAAIVAKHGDERSEREAQVTHLNMDVSRNGRVLTAEVKFGEESSTGWHRVRFCAGKLPKPPSHLHAPGVS